MVDFNQDSTMTKPRKDIVNFMILQTLQDIIIKQIAWETTQNKEGIEFRELKAQLKGILTLITKPISKGITQTEYKTIEQLRETITQARPEEIYPIIDYITNFLYDKDVTKWDTKEPHDRTNIIEMNEASGI